MVLLAAVTLTQAQNGKKSSIEMPAIFSDNMVLQQKTNAPFWGKANPDEKIFIQASWGKSARAVAGIDSFWQTKLRTPKAGGPYEIKIQIGDSSIVYKNVLIGEVWLCSGQSNMEMPLQGWPPHDTISGSSEAIRNADNSNIRLLTVTRSFSDKPKFNFIGSWQKSSSETAARFSAAAFFFGRKLFKELKIPIGLILSSWGGTPVEAWINKKNLEQFEEFKETLKKIDGSSSEILKLNEWLNAHPIIDVSSKDSQHRWEDLTFMDDECSLPVFNDSLWKEMNLPTVWEKTELGNYDGAVWFRKKIEIPESWLNKELTISLGPIDDMDITFVNGKKIGGYETDGNWQTERIYTIPAELVKEKLITIAVRVVDNQGGGGIFGDKEKMKIYPTGSDETVSLEGSWKYLPVAEYRNMKFYIFGAKGEKYYSRPQLPIDLSAYIPTALYNAMIAPIIPYSIKGVIWYQGESNTENPEQYKILFPLMIKNWREDWMQGNFPFYYVQIAPYKYDEPIQSQKLREAQFFTLSTPKTGMVVTLDIGNPNNIHPSNKKDVGERLALWALAKDYNKKIVYSGPLYKSMKIVKDKIILFFDGVDGRLFIKEKNGGTNFLIAGEDKIFKKAEVKIIGKKIFVSNPEIKKPAAVRYAWNNSAEATLFNKAGLPASSFRTDNWEE